MNSLKDHIIICGLNATSLSIVDTLDAYLTRHGQDGKSTARSYILIDSDEEAVNHVASRYNHFNSLIGDATEDEILRSAGIETAYGIFPVLEQNKDNLFITFTARKLNPDIRIVARTTDISRIEEKLINAGADSVISPNAIGGMRIVSEMVRPHSVAFLDHLLRQKNTDLVLEEEVLTERCSICGKPIQEIAALSEDSLRAIALKKRGGGTYIYNPDGTTLLESGDILVIFGKRQAMNEFRKTINQPADN